MTTGTTGQGLRYAILRSGHAVGYCALTIKCGTRDEGEHHSGIAHFTEHTIFKGTEYRSARAINSHLDRLGGDLNAYTTKEEIVIHATVLKEDLPKAMSLLLELATCPTFPEDEVAVEKGVVIDEINSCKDSPADDVYDKFEEALFGNHPLGKPILGTAASVRKITSEELRAFVKEMFVSGNMAMTVVADCEEKRVEDAINRLCAKYFKDNVMSNERAAAPLAGAELFDKRVEKRNHEVNAVLGGLAPSVYSGAERDTAILMNNILGGPAGNSMLNNLLREKNGWVYGVESSYSQYTEAGVLAISLGCERGNLEKCLKAVGTVIRKLQEEELSPTKLKAAKKQLLGQIAIGSDNGETQCLSMGKSLITFGKVFTRKQDREAIEAVTGADIQRLARSIFDPSNLSSLIYL